MTSVETTMPSGQEVTPMTYRIAWLEHPFALPVLFSNVLATLILLALIPIEGAAWWVWAIVILWIAGNAVAVRAISRRLERSEGESQPDDIHGRSQWVEALLTLRRNFAAMVSVCLLIILITSCVGLTVLYEMGRPTAEQISAADRVPDDPNSFYTLHLNPMYNHKDQSFAAPTAEHWFGTDNLGRDLFARTLYGGRISFLVGLVATAVSLVIGITWGAVAAYVGGRVDHYMMRIVDVLYGLPFMFLVILVLSLVNGLSLVASQNRDALHQYDVAATPAEREQVVQANGLENITSIRTAIFLSNNLNPIVVMFFALGLVSWLTMARIARGQVLSIKEREFVVAARTIGAGPLRIIFFHIIPNLLGPVIVYTTLTIPSMMLSEAFLSFLGLGISQPDCSWGSLASEGLAGVNVIKPYWWLLVYPSVGLALSLFSLNFLGDGLRDALDPRRTSL